MPDANNVINELERTVSRFVQRLTLDVTANLIETTPVDTGWARANWIPNIGTSFRGTDGTREQAEAGSVSASAQQTGQANVLRYSISRGPLYVTNNVPYIVRLNEGSSRQAPAGFVQNAIMRAIVQSGARRVV